MTPITQLLLGRTEFKHQLEEGFHTLAYAFFVPLFFVSIGLQANARARPGRPGLRAGDQRGGDRVEAAR